MQEQVIRDEEGRYEIEKRRPKTSLFLLPLHCTMHDVVAAGGAVALILVGARAKNSLAAIEGLVGVDLKAT